MTVDCGTIALASPLSALLEQDGRCQLVGRDSELIHLLPTSAGGWDVSLDRDHCQQPGWAGARGGADLRRVGRLPAEAATGVG